MPTDLASPDLMRACVCGGVSKQGIGLAVLSWLFVISGLWTIGLEPFVVVPGVVLDVPLVVSWFVLLLL